MGARGLNGSNGSSSNPFPTIIADLNQAEAVSKEQPENLGIGSEAKVEHLHPFLTPAIERREHTSTRPKVESMSQSDSNATFAELRAQLAEARSDGKLAEAIGKSDARYAEVVGRLDTGLTDIKGQITAVNTRLEGIERMTGGIKTTVMVTGLTVVAIIVAILTYGQTWFGIGITTRDAVKAEVTSMQQQAKPPAGNPP